MYQDSSSISSCPSVDKCEVIHKMSRMYTMYYIAEICILGKQNWVKNYVVGGPL